MSTKGRNTQRFTTCEGGQRKAPFCEELREFFSVSRNCQTFFANCEGSYSRRTVQLENSNILQQFICNTLYAEDDCHFENLPAEKYSHVLKISKKITSLCHLYSLGEAHLASLLICCFDYESKTHTHVPLFKIYKRKQGSEFCFLDVNLVLYDNWNNYLDYAKFLPSFLCVPRGGKYVFVDAKLDVEFLSTKSGISTSEFNLFSFKPFYESKVLPLIQNVKTMQARTVEEMKRIAYYLMDFVQKNSNSILKFFTLAVVSYLKGSGSAFPVWNIALMLIPEFLNVIFFPLPCSEESVLNIGSRENNFRDPSLLMEEKKDCDNVFKCFSEFASDILPFIPDVLDWLQIAPEWTPVLRNLLPLLKRTPSVAERVKNRTLGPAGDNLKFRETSHFDKSSGSNDRGTDAAETCDEILSCFSKLGTEFVGESDPSDTQKSRIVDNSTRHQSGKSVNKIPDISHYCVIEGCLSCLLPKASPSSLNEVALFLFGSGVSFSVVEKSCSKVLNAVKEEVGVLYFVDGQCSMGSFSVRHMREDAKMHFLTR